MKASLIGRDNELEQASSVLDAAGPRAFVISGAAGVGKSRLLTEVADHAERRGWTVERLYASPAARDIALGAVAHLMPDDGIDDLTTLFRAVRAELGRRTGDGRLLLAVDDGHELDDGSAALVHQLAAHDDARVVITSRGTSTSAAITALWKEEMATRLELGPLDRPSTDRLVAELLDGAVEPALLDAVWSLSQGHPLYVRVSLDAARESGDVALRSGSWALVGRLSSDRLEALVLSRTHQIDDEARRALHLVAAANPLREDVLLRLVPVDAVDSLRRRGLVVTIVVDGRVHVATAHPLYAETVVNGLPPSMRRRLANELADAFVTEPLPSATDRLLGAIWMLEAGRTVPPALALDAGDEAVLRGDHALAERLCRPLVDDQHHSTRARITLGRALAFGGRGDEADDVLAGARPHGDPETATLALVRGHNLAFVLGRPDEGVAVLADAASGLDRSLRWQLDADRALYGAISGDFSAARDAARAALANPNTPEPARVTAHVNLVLAQAMTGRLDDFDRYTDAGMHLAGRHSTELPLASEQLTVARLSGWCAAGRISEARSLCEAELAARDGAARPMSLSWLGIISGLQGRLQEAVASLERVIAAYEIMDPFRLHPQAHGVLALHQAQAGTVPAGIDELLDRAGEEACSETRLAVWIGRGRAWMAASRGDIQRACELAAHAGREAVAHDHTCWGIWALHDAVRFGHADDVLEPLVEALATTSGALLGETMRDHAKALAARDREGLQRAATEFCDHGAPLLAAEAAVQAARTAHDHGELTASRRSSLLAQQLRKTFTSVSTPALVDPPEALSSREFEVAERAAEGRTSREIADALFVSVRTVDNHLRSVYRKLGLAGRDELAALIGQVRSPNEQPTGPR